MKKTICIRADADRGRATWERMIVPPSGEDLEAGGAELLGQVGDLHAEAPVGLVAAVAPHRLGVAETVERRLELDADQAPVLADERWMHQVVTNLLGNALKFTPAGGTVTIRTWQDGPGAVLEVADTGVGIPAGELPRVFDRFWRGQAAAQTSGSGIGLAIAAELTLAHGGTLTAASEPGVRTLFTLTLPGA